MFKKNQSKRILIIHPDGNIYDNHNFYEMVEFLKQHYEVKILTIALRNRQNDHADFKDNIIFYFRGWRKIFLWTNSNIIRYIFLNLYLFGRKKYDFILGVDRESIIQASILSRASKTPYALLSYEIFFEDETSARFKAPEREACKNITFAIVQDEERKKHLCEQNRIDPHKVMLMPVAAGSIKRGPKNYFLHEALHIPRDKKILLYAGSVEGWTGFPTLIYLIEALLPQDWVFVFHHKNKNHQWETYKDNFIARSRRVFFSDIELPTRHDFSKLLFDADLGLVCYYPTFANMYLGQNITYMGLSSGKFNTYLQHGLPVLALYPPSLANLTQQHNLGIGTTDMRNIDLARFDKKSYEQNCYDFYEKILSFENVKDELLARIKASINGGGGKNSLTPYLAPLTLIRPTQAPQIVTCTHEGYRDEVAA